MKADITEREAMRRDAMKRDTNYRISKEHSQIVRSTYPMREDITIKASIFNDSFRLHMDQLNRAFPGRSTIPVPMTKEKYAQACAVDVCLMTQRLYDSIMQKAAARAVCTEEHDWEEDE